VIFKVEQVGGRAMVIIKVMMSECSERVGEISSYLNRKAERGTGIK